MRTFARRFVLLALAGLCAACAAAPTQPPDDLRLSLAWYDRVLASTPPGPAHERALAEEVFYLFHLGGKPDDLALPYAYLAAMEALTERLAETNGQSPWLAQAWYHVGEGRMSRGDREGASDAYARSTAAPAWGAPGVYILLSFERLEELARTQEGRPPPSP